MSLFRPRFRRRFDADTIDALYGMIVAQARSVAFYADYGVPDTVQGRFELIVLHLVLFLRRLQADTVVAGATGRELGERLFAVFCRDLDHNLREMGIGDLAVPKHMRRFGEAFYGRQAAYSAALSAEDGRELEKALARNIFDRVDVDHRAERLARYTRAAAAQLNGVEQGALMCGQSLFPSPEAFAHARA
jgi:cytochrome b pre-mRNA-processing protein 3